MHCSLLGSLQVRVDGQPIEIGGARLRALLARLALDAGRTVSVEALVDALWSDNPPSGAANALQSLVSRLRRSLGDAELIGSTPAGYRLAAESTDIAAFERLADEGRTALRNGDSYEARTALHKGLGLWRGPALADVGDAPFAAPAARRLEELRLAAVEDRVAAELQLGGHAEVVAELEGLVGAHPLRERLRGQHITALYRAGRQADALASYETARELLADRLGVDPSPELQKLQLAVLRGELATPVDSGVARTNLRAQLTSFVGRADDVAAITELLGGHRLLTLVGPGGAGKTRLASEVGADLLRQLPDGVWMVELAPVTDPAGVAHAVLSALGLRERAMLEAGPDNRDIITRLVTALAGKRLLLVLDNCEHLIGAAAELADTLLARCAQLRILATSREPLAISGETLRPVLPLTVEGGAAPAVQLFAERAVAVSPHFQLEAWHDTATDICRRLDGMPLAIELAAARLRSLTPDELAARLDNRFRLLTGGSRAALPRHQTLRAVVDWSWDLLEKPERILARRLSVFPGGVTVQTAEEVCADADLPVEDIVDLLSALVDKSLLQPVGDTERAGSGGRYRMLETIRAYGQEQLDTVAEQATVRARHAAYFLALAEEAEPHTRRADQLEWLRRVHVEHDNMLAALHFYTETSDAAGAIRLCAALTWFWSLRGFRAEANTWLTEAVSVPGERPPGPTAMVYAGQAMLHGNSGEPKEAAWALARAMRIVRADPTLIETHPLLGLLRGIAAMAGRRSAERVDSEVLVAMRHPDPWTRAVARMMLGHSYTNQGRATEASEQFVENLAEFRVLGDRWGLAATLEAITSIRQLHGDLEATLTIQQEAIDLLTELEAFEDVAQGLSQRALNEIRTGRAEAARTTVERASMLARRYGSPESVLFVESVASEVARRTGDLAEARRRAELALTQSRHANLMPDQLGSFFLVGLGFVEIDDGHVDRACELFEDAVGLAEKFEDRAFVATAVDGLAIAALVLGDPRRSALLLGIAESARGLPDLGNPDVVAAIEQARTALGAGVFDAVYQEGVTMPYDLALEFAAPGQARRR